MNESVLEVRNLKKYFPVTKGLLLMKRVGLLKAVDDVTFAIGRSETFGLVGESGCGKTTTAKLILLLEKPSSGSIRFRGTDIQHLSVKNRSMYHRGVQSVFQDPYGSLNPRMRVQDIIAEPMLAGKTIPKKLLKERIAEIMELVGLSPSAAKRYPHEFSGGQRQRIAIGRAVSINPQVIVLDEPVSALDVSIRAQIMNLLCQLQDTIGITYLLIAHDLAVVRHMSKRIGVMYLGKLVETAESEDLFQRPLHPYTKAMISAALPLHPNAPREEIILPGDVPSPLDPPSGCNFHTRCPIALTSCSEQVPTLKNVGGTHEVACLLVS